MAIVLFTTLTAFYTHILLQLAVQYDRFIHSGGDPDYSLNLNKRTRAGLTLFALSILEIIHSCLAIFYPSLLVTGQMKLGALALFSLFAAVLATMLFGIILIIRQCKQTDIDEAETGWELNEIVSPAEEGPAEVVSLDDSLDLD